MLSVHGGPTTGLLTCLLLLGALDRTVGLDGPGWVVGVMCGVGGAVALGAGVVRHRVERLGPADRVTLTRASMACGVAALTADSFHGSAPVTTLVAITVVALVLDWVDGQVARRTRTASGFGGRFDMEVDAFLVLVLSVYVARSAGAWVLAIGVARYVLLAASGPLPWLRRATPPRYWGKVVAATQGVVLTVAAADVLGRGVVVAALAGALLLLAESFGHQAWWLWRHRPADLSHPQGADGETSGRSVASARAQEVAT